MDGIWMLKDLLIDCGAVKFGKFILASGKESNYYIDIKKASTNPAVLSEISNEMAKYIDKKGYDRIAGMELGAVPIAVALSLRTELPYLIIRKEERTHGTGKQIEGEFRSNDRIIIVEDVTTTGQSSLKTIEILRNACVVTDTVMTVVDRQEGAEQLLSASKVKLIALVKASDLLKV